MDGELIPTEFGHVHAVFGVPAHIEDVGPGGVGRGVDEGFANFVEGDGAAPDGAGVFEVEGLFVEGEAGAEGDVGAEVCVGEGLDRVSYDDEGGRSVDVKV
jgi:hypothetical protein